MSAPEPLYPFHGSTPKGWTMTPDDVSKVVKLTQDLDAANRATLRAQQECVELRERLIFNAEMHEADAMRLVSARDDYEARMWKLHDALIRIADMACTDHGDDEHRPDCGVGIARAALEAAK